MAATKILVVDDDRESCDLLREVLEEKGYAVTVVRDGESALRELDRQSSIRIVIADLRMPGKSGLDLLRELRRQNSRYTIVLMSSFINDAERQTARRLNVNGLLDKPFRLSDLVQMVSNLAEKNAAGRANEEKCEDQPTHQLRGARWT